MTRSASGKQGAGYAGVIAGLIIVLFWVAGADAKSSTAPPTKPSTAPPSSVTKAPVCDIGSHPKITQVTPDPVKPGQRIMIKGKNFGTKACFQNVSFGSVGANEYKYVSDTTLEATVPNLKPGLVPVSILTAGGSSQFVLLIQAK
ncbi:MAG: IPT/TIG domain-containing protein [Nitrospirae bacterium]|nr:IPT/TIG domain-containing protein [Nitrospirota bacterium]